MASGIKKASYGVFSLLSKPLQREVEKLGWRRPTAAQRLAIPPILNGENVLLIAPTGTGKTEAAVFPIFEQFIKLRNRMEMIGTSIVYITPLRALNRDVFRRLVEIGERLGIDVQVRHGDTPSKIRRQQALKAPKMLITTPETLQAILPGRKIRKHLKHVKWVIVDEIHEIAADKRGIQLSLGLERLGKIAESGFQRIGLSATVGSPKLIAKFLGGSNREVKIIKAVAVKDYEVRVESPVTTPEDVKLSKKLMISAGSIRRIRRLLELIGENNTTLVFTNTREHAEALASRIRLLEPDLEIGVHHGSLSKRVRVEAEQNLKSGLLKGVVCTSSLELGIDVGNIDFIVQYMSPRQSTRLIQRLGRGGHVLGAVSRGVVLASMPDDVLESAVISRLMLKGMLEPLRKYRNALDVLAHQITGLTLEYGRVRLVDVLEIVRRAWPYEDVTIDEVTDVVEQLDRQGIIWFDGEYVKKRRGRCFNYYFTNLSTIPNVKRFSVQDFLSKKRIGSLDQEFIATRGKPGQEIIMHGQTWRVLIIDEENDFVQVEAVDQSLGAIPSWEGEIIPVPFEVAQEVGMMKKIIAEKVIRHEDPLEVLQKYPMDNDSSLKIVNAVQKQLEAGFPIPTHHLILIETVGNYTVIHACFGNLINQAIGHTLAALLSARLSVNVAIRCDSYHIALIIPSKVNSEVIRKELELISAGDIRSILTNTLGETFLFAWHLWNVSKRFGIVEHDADYRSGRAKGLAKALRNTVVYQEAFNELFSEKIDVEGAEHVIEMIGASKIEIKAVHDRKEFSPFAIPILDKIAPQDILRPATPKEEIIPIVKERLYAKEAKFICVFNADWHGIRKIRSLPNKIKCPRCSSSLIAMTYRNDDELFDIIKKKVSRRKMSKIEERKWLTAWKSASLIQNYGLFAAITMAGRGVGPRVAARILRKPYESDDDLILEILRAEREYARTRLFWDN